MSPILFKFVMEKTKEKLLIKTLKLSILKVRIIHYYFMQTTLSYITNIRRIKKDNTNIRNNSSYSRIKSQHFKDKIHEGRKTT